MSTPDHSTPLLDQADRLPYVIAELGLNHNGSIDTAKRLIDAVAEAGADCAKVQIYRTEHLLSTHHTSDETIQIFQSHQLSPSDYQTLQTTANNAGIDLAASVFDRERLEWYIDETEAPFIKIASGDLTFKRLQTRAGDAQKPVVLSTGGGTLDEITRAIDWISSEPDQLHILHCIPDYPASIDQLRLGAIPFLYDQLNRPVGFSDHSQSQQAPITARKLGAVLWERHVTLDPTQTGPEHSFSMGIDSFSETIDQLKSTPVDKPDDQPANSNEMVGKAGLPDKDSFKSFRQQARRSLMADRPLSAGTLLKEDMVRELRPGNGLPPERIDDCLGIPVPRPTDPGEMISY